MVATALFTGLRCAELVNFRLDAVSFDGGFCRVVGKGSKTREVPLIPRLAVILTAYLRDTRPHLVLTAESPYVFPADLRPGRLHRHGTARWRSRQRPRQSTRRRLTLGAPLTTRGFFHVVRVHCSALVGRPVHPHMLRHSFASRLRAKGDTLRVYRSGDRVLVAELPATFLLTLVEHYLTGAALQAQIANHMGPADVLPPESIQNPLPTPRLRHSDGRRLRGREEAPCDDHSSSD